MPDGVRQKYPEWTLRRLDGGKLLCGPTRPCIWYAIYHRAERLGRTEKLLEILPPLDWEKAGTETWLDVYREVRKVGVRDLVAGLASRDPVQRTRVWDSVFYPVRQPVWWRGDAEYHPPKYTEPVSELDA